MAKHHDATLLKYAIQTMFRIRSARQKYVQLEKNRQKYVQLELRSRSMNASPRQLSRKSSPNMQLPSIVYLKQMKDIMR